MNSFVSALRERRTHPAIAALRSNLESEPKRTDGMRYEALRVADSERPHATPAEVVERATAYFNFLKGE